MSLSITCQNKADYLEITISGNWTLPEMKSAIDEVKFEADKCKQYLLLLKMQEIIPPFTEMTRYYTGEYMAKVLPSPFKIAVIAKKESVNYFAETVAVNRGANMKVFFNEELAKEWLIPSK